MTLLFNHVIYGQFVWSILVFKWQENISKNLCVIKIKIMFLHNQTRKEKLKSILDIEIGHGSWSTKSQNRREGHLFFFFYNFPLVFTTSFSHSS
jgi:hypothetical protein